jgi:hypothetical protein
MALAALAALDSGALGGIFSLSLLVSNSANARSEKADPGASTEVETRATRGPHLDGVSFFIYPLD